MWLCSWRRSLQCCQPSSLLSLLPRAQAALQQTASSHCTAARLEEQKYTVRLRFRKIGLRAICFVRRNIMCRISELDTRRTEPTPPWVQPCMTQAGVSFWLKLIKTKVIKKNLNTIQLILAGFSDKIHVFLLLFLSYDKESYEVCLLTSSPKQKC